MDISSTSNYPSSALSNFASHSFVFDGVECASMEGLLQSFKFDEPQVQFEICGLVGVSAKRRGRERDDAWKLTQKLWWNGVEYDRHGDEYQRLLDCAFDALSQALGFQEALLATGSSLLTHTIGNSNALETCLTEHEFCSRLERIRTRLQQT